MKQMVLALALILVVGACGDDPAADTTATTAPPTTSSPTTTVTPTTPPTTPPSTTPPTTAPPTTLPVTTTTTVAPITTTTVPGAPFTTATYGYFPDPFANAASGHGSGCAPGAGPLPDGMWFGFVEGLSGGTAAFDLACFYTGAAGWAAATADGEVGYDLDFYISNQVATTRAVPLSATGTAYWLDATAADLTPLPIAMTAWPTASPPNYHVCPSDFCPVWLLVNGGAATELVEQYLP